MELDDLGLVLVPYTHQRARRLQVLAHAAPGKIVVFHNGHHRNPQADRRYAIEATRRIIEGLQARRHEFPTLCEFAH